jgi:hypothetical protein
MGKKVPKNSWHPLLPKLTVKVAVEMISVRKPETFYLAYSQLKSCIKLEA